MDLRRKSEDRNRMIPLINEVIAQIKRISIKLWLLKVDTTAGGPTPAFTFASIMLSPGIKALNANHTPKAAYIPETNCNFFPRINLGVLY